MMGRREKGLRALRGTEGREKQEDDKIGKRGRKRQQLYRIADISLGYIIYNAPLSAQWRMCINPLPRENQLIFPPSNEIPEYKYLVNYFIW